MFKYVAALLLWKIDIENDDIRTGLRGICVGLVEKLNCLLAIPHDMEVDGKVGPLDGSPDEIHIRRIILDDEDLPTGGGRRFLRGGR